MKARPLTTLSSLLLTAAAVAGSPPSTGKTPPLPTPEKNPLSFFDGKLIFDFQEKIRFEGRDNTFDFNDSVNALTDDSFLLQRARLGVKLTPFSGLTLYAQGQDTREIDSDRPNVIGSLGAEGDDTFDLRQGYIEIGDPKKLSLKVGRQVLQYGDERLIGPLEWANQSRTFDAIKFHYATDTWWVDAFTSSVVKFEDEKFNKSDWLDSDSTRDQIFSGIYFGTSAIDFQTTEFYALHLMEEFAAGDSKFFTLGTHLKGDPKKLGGYDYDIEAAYQFGDVKGKDLSAFAGHAAVGYNWSSLALKPRLGLEYNYATGDSNAADGEVETFQNLFPTNHKFYGYMDLFSWQNIHNVAISSSIVPCKDVKLSLDYQAFWLANTNDAWYRANGATAVRPINGDASSFAGTEIDFTATWKASKNLSFLVGYSHFFAGDYLSDTGPSSDADFVYVQASIDF
jgi:hypothetical protein